MTPNNDVSQAFMVARLRRELRRTRHAFVMAAAIAATSTAPAALGWLRWWLR